MVYLAHIIFEDDSQAFVLQLPYIQQIVYQHRNVVDPCYYLHKPIYLKFHIAFAHYFQGIIS